MKANYKAKAQPCLVNILPCTLICHLERRREKEEGAGEGGGEEEKEGGGGKKEENNSYFHLVHTLPRMQPFAPYTCIPQCSVSEDFIPFM